MHCTMQAVWIVIVVADCWLLYIQLFLSTAGGSLWSFSHISNMPVFYMYIFYIWAFNMLHKFSEWHDRLWTVQSSNQSMWKGMHCYQREIPDIQSLCSQPEERLDVFYLLYIRYTQTEIYSPIKKAFRTQAKQNWHRIKLSIMGICTTH